MRRFKLGVLFVACCLGSTFSYAKKYTKAVSTPHAAMISSASALHDLMTAEFLARDHAFSAAAKLYFPYAIHSPYREIVSRAATFSFLSGNFRQSERLAKHWLKLEPKELLAYQILLASQVNFEQYPDANATLTRYLHIEDTGKTGAEPVLPVFKALLQNLGEVQATEKWECLIEHTKNLDIRYRLQLAMGILLLDAHDPQVIAQGMAALKEAMDEHPELVEPAVHYALLMAKEHPNQAGPWLTKAIAKRSDTEANFLIAGFILSARKGLALAEPVFKQAVDLYPKNTAFKGLYLESLLENRKYAAAQKELVQLLTVLSPEEHRTTELAIQLMRMARTPAERETAVTFLRHVPATDEDYEPVQEILLYQLSELDPERAVAHLEELSAHHKRGFSVPASWWLFPAEAFHKQNKLPAALEVIDRALVVYPGAEDLLEAKALLLCEANRMSEAESIWRDLIERFPDQHSFYNNLGYVLLDKMGRVNDAEPLIRKAYAMAPKDAAVLDSMGWLYFKLKQPKEAMHYFDEALSAGNPDDPEILLHVAEVAAAAGDVSRVKTVLQKIEKIKSKHWEPLETLEKRLGTQVE